MTTAVAVSWLLAFAALVLVWNGFLLRRSSASAWGALVYAAFAPGRVYSYALFPLSLLTVATLAHLRFLHRGRWVAAGVAGAIAALSYPVGVVLAVTSGIWILSARSDRLRDRGLRAAVVVGLTALGGAVVVVVQWLEVGRWNAYFLVEGKYGIAPQDPFVPTERAIRTLVHSSPFHVANAPAVQTILVTVVLVSVLAELSLHRLTVTRFDVLVALWAIGTWSVTQSGANGVSVYRSEASLLPLALLMRRLPFALVAPLVTIAVLLVVPMTRLFLRSLLV